MTSNTKSKLSGKVVGVIGSTFPDKPYQGYMGFLVGLMLSKALGKGNTIAVGGVTGVGVDAFSGYASNKESGVDFVALIPESYVLDEEGADMYSSKEPQYLPYSLPIQYDLISENTGAVIKEIVCSKDMADRRKEFMLSCDIVVMLNGGPGTYDEANIALKNETPVISVTSSGGAAEFLMHKASGRQFSAFLERRFNSFAGMPRVRNPHLVEYARSITDVEPIVKRLLTELL